MKPVRWLASISLLTLASLVSGYPGPAARGNDAIADLDAFITKALKEYQVPGAAVAVSSKRIPFLAPPYMLIMSSIVLFPGVRMRLC